jgi:hypothetical protein
VAAFHSRSTSIAYLWAAGLSLVLFLALRRRSPAASGLRELPARNSRPYEFAVTARMAGTRCNIDTVLVSFIFFVSLYCYCFALVV